MTYTPLNYEQINVAAGLYNPSTVKSVNNKTYAFWERALFHRACSVLQFELPAEWQGPVKDFFYYCLFRYGFVCVFQADEFGLSFQPCTLSGYNFYYQPTTARVANPLLPADKSTFKIGEDCEIIKATPDYFGIWDVISYYAEKLSILDNAINMSLINNKFAFMIGARNKTAGEALKKMLDKVNRGEPAVIYDMKLLNDPQDKAEPWQFLERKDLKSSYLTDQQLADFNQLISNFDTEIGIPVLPYQKKERMVVSEAESKTIDATSRSVVWYETIKSSLEIVNKHFGSGLSVKLRFNPDDPESESEEEADE